MVTTDTSDVPGVTVQVVDAMYFSARASCGHSWTGMRHTDDVRIVVDRAMDHDCARAQR